MKSLIILVFGLMVGFGGGIWFGVQHPEWAKGMAEKEEQVMLKAKIEAMKKSQEALDKILEKSSTTNPSAVATVPPSGNTRSAFGGVVSGGATDREAVEKALAEKKRLADDIALLEKQLKEKK